MPYVMKLIDQEMTAMMNGGFRFLTSSTVTQLKDAGFEWTFPDSSEVITLQDRVGDSDRTIDKKNEAAARSASAKKAAATKARNKAALLGLSPIPEQSEVGPKTASATATGVAALPTVAIPVTAIEFSRKMKNEFFILSNYAETPFQITGTQPPAPDGTEYPPLPTQAWPTVEHYYQAMKFPQDPAWQEEIRMARSPESAKKMGVTKEHPARGDWTAVRDRIMKGALLKKFSQNPAALGVLQKTAGRSLYDTSPGDVYWGVDVRGKGENRLGKLLEEVRSELKDMRPEEALFSGSVGSNSAAGGGGSSAGGDAGGGTGGGEVEESGGEGAEGPEDTVSQASATLQAGGFRSVDGGGNPIYMFINGGAAVEQKTRAARQRGSGRSLSWEGMQVSKEGGSQDGGAMMTTEGDHAVEVKVEKLG
jgi:ribA/ribD-fused uncharacterized protein